MTTSYVVLDSGILLATVQAERYTEHAKTLIRQLAEQEFEIAAPYLIRYEMVAVTRKWVHRGLATPVEATAALETLLGYPLELYFDEPLLHRAYDLASTYNQPSAYDAQYLAVAERLSCLFWTADERLFNSIHEHFSGIRWLGNIQLDDVDSHD